MRLLLISNSMTEGMGYLEHAKPAMRDFLDGGVRRALFLPYARVMTSYDAYLEQVAPPFRDLGYEVIGIHRLPDPVRAVDAAEAILVGGGNTWRLAREVHRLMLADPIRRKVRGGTPYIGWSAGSNLACPTFQTTNDMPICEPLGFDALGLVPFQLNPHYLDGSPPGFKGETREERIREYLELHPNAWVVGLREGTMFRVEDGEIRLIGARTCRVFRKGAEPCECGANDSLTFLRQ